MLSRQNSNHDSTHSASDSSTIDDDSHQGVGRALFRVIRRAGTMVERRLVLNERTDPLTSASTATFISSSEWDNLSESSTISYDRDQGVGRTAWKFMRYAGEQVELLTIPDKLAQKAKARSRAIDNQIKREGKVNRNTNILVVGTSGAGKSTLIKQMKLHNGSYTKTEREAFKPIIISTSVHAMTDIISIVRGRGLQLSLDNKSYAETILNFRQTGSLDCVDVPEDLSAALLSLYEDVAVRQVLARPPKLDLECSTLYFVQGILRITAAGYVPTDQDILYCHKKTNDMRETSVSSGNFTLNFCELPCHYSLHKWISYFENVGALIFVTALSDYNRYRNKRPCMEEALTLFESICSSRSIPKTCGIILILNKLDCFREKLARLPLQSYCPNYTGGNNVGKACDYFLQGFRAMNGQSRRLYPSVIALREGIVNVQGVIQDSVMRRSLQETNVL